MDYSQSKHPAPPPPAYGSSSGQHPKAPRDPPVTPASAEPGASSQAPPRSMEGVPPKAGQPIPQHPPVAAEAIKPPQAANMPSGSVASQSKAADAKPPPGLKGELKGGDPSGAPAPPQPAMPLRSSLEGVAARTGPSTAAPSAPMPGHRATGTAVPQPVKSAPGLSRAHPEAAPADSAMSAAQGSAEAHRAKGEAPGTSHPLPATTAAGPPPAGGKAPQQYYKGALLHRAGRAAPFCCTLTMPGMHPSSSV